MFRTIVLVCVILGSVVSADPNTKIPTHRSVDLKVGQSVVVNGYRGECGSRPNNVDPNRTRNTKLGILSNGKWGVTKSRTCGGWTPAVEVIFTAKKKGRETIEVAGTKIKVTVR
ncbi:hypothetical protein [uncultured Ruegeria sp.]|uniref:hypothetical protein n=1 Tax=uncultured Ruegeria sp. TaxID=259304 RepID=UPI00262D46C0|nr:hypothetical protein [uncultured Ruegeria sp.]